MSHDNITDTYTYSELIAMELERAFHSFSFKLANRAYVAALCSFVSQYSKKHLEFQTTGVCKSLIRHGDCVRPMCIVESGETPSTGRMSRRSLVCHAPRWRS
jgi:hypothetical protein